MTLTMSKLIRGGADVNELHLDAGDSLATALSQLESTGGTIHLHGDPSIETRTVNGDGIRIRPAGKIVNIVAVAGQPALNVLGDDFCVDGDGMIWFDADSTSAVSTGGIFLRGKRSVIRDCRFHRFGNQTTPLQSFSTAPYAIKIQGIAPSTWADWHHFYGVHIEFCHSGLLNWSGSNAKVFGLTAREIHKGGIWSVTGSPDGNVDGAAMHIYGPWITHQDSGEFAVILERLSGARRNGAIGIYGGVVEAGEGNPGKAVKVQSDNNELFFKSFVGGSVGYSWEDVGDGKAKNNHWHTTSRSATGGVGPPVDQGFTSDQQEIQAV